MQGLSQEVCGRSAGQEIPNFSRKSSIRYRINKSLPLDPILNQTNPEEISGSHGDEYQVEV
jgi:hypothetical protein